MDILETELFRRALIALHVHDQKTYILVAENLLKGTSPKELGKRYALGKTTVYKRLKEGRTFLLGHIGQDPWSAAKEKGESVNAKFPRINGRY